MARYKNVNGERIPFTPQEEAQRDAEEAYEADPQREVERTEAEEAGMMGRVEIKGIDRAQFEALLDHENRIRVLEGKLAVTADQMKAWVKERL